MNIRKLQIYIFSSFCARNTKLYHILDHKQILICLKLKQSIFSHNETRLEVNKKKYRKMLKHLKINTLLNNSLDRRKYPKKFFKCIEPNEIENTTNQNM